MPVPTPLKKLAVRVVKPVVSDTVWSRLSGSSAGRSAPAAAPSRHPTPAQQRRERRRSMSLTELALEFKTDKATIHQYTQHYERHLQHLRDEEFTLVEIGIGGYGRQGAGGASLRMWKWFFARARIVGLDIQDKKFVEERRITVYQGSQVDEAVLRRIVDENGPITVIIDDGSHRPAHIRETFRILFPLLEDGGVYVIEDTQTSYWPELGGNDDLAAPDTTMALVKGLVDGLNFEEFVDETYEPTYTDLNVRAVHCYHNLVFIEKGNNVEGTNRRRVLRQRYEASPDPASAP